jgi:uncharacterized membrane protein
MSMNTKMVITQFKREFWENKTSFFITPALVTAFIIVMAICASLYSGGLVNKNGVQFHYTNNNVPLQADVKLNDENSAPKLEMGAQSDENKTIKNFNIVTSVEKDPTAFDGMVLGSMYANCALLFLVFAIVLASYSLRCLFDDRKNKDILFWHSMPVSETTNVLVKLGMILLVAPAVILALNLIITFLFVILGVIFLACFGVKISFLLSSVFGGQSLYIPFQVFYELIFSLLMSLPIIGFALFVSALAKKSPFFMFMSPALLALVDILLNKFFGINVGFIDLCSLYFGTLVHAKGAFILQEAFVFDASMLLPSFTCVGVGAMFIAGAIWLRNNRNEI